MRPDLFLDISRYEEVSDTLSSRSPVRLSVVLMCVGIVIDFAFLYLTGYRLPVDLIEFYIRLYTWFGETPQSVFQTSLYLYAGFILADIVDCILHEALHFGAYRLFRYHPRMRVDIDWMGHILGEVILLNQYVQRCHHIICGLVPFVLLTPGYYWLITETSFPYFKLVLMVAFVRHLSGCCSDLMYSLEALVSFPKGTLYYTTETKLWIYFPKR